MKSSSTITASVELIGELYTATTQQFPNAIGQGATAKDALESLSKALEEYFLPVGPLKSHPLCPVICDWANSTSGPPIPFLPNHVFLDALKSLPLDEEGKRQTFETYSEAAILGSALVGGDYNEAIHQALYMATGHPLGFALAHAAGLASRVPQFFKAFSKSTQTPGFLKALEAWAERNELTKPFDGKKELKWINRNLVTKDHPAASYWQNVCQGGFESVAKFNKALANEVRLAEAAARDETKRRKRGVDERDADFIHSIKIMWVPGALWCLSDSGIVATLDPEKTSGMSEAYDKVRRNISTLGFSKSRMKTS